MRWRGAGRWKRISGRGRRGGATARSAPRSSRSSSSSPSVPGQGSSERCTSSRTRAAGRWRCGPRSRHRCFGCLFPRRRSSRNPCAGSISPTASGTSGPRRGATGSSGSSGSSSSGRTPQGPMPRRSSLPTISFGLQGYTCDLHVGHLAPMKHLLQGLEPGAQAKAMAFLDKRDFDGLYRDSSLEFRAVGSLSAASGLLPMHGRSRSFHDHRRNPREEADRGDRGDPR